MSFRKDRSLDELARGGNVAQFVGFAPSADQQFSRVTGFDANHVFATNREAIEALLAASPEGTINIRASSRKALAAAIFITVSPTLMKLWRWWTD
jgi:hypothetical protein